MNRHILSLVILLALCGASGAAPVTIELTELERDRDLVTAREVRSNALLTLYFRSHPDPANDSELVAALRSRALVEVRDATNSIAQGTLVGAAHGEDREHHKLFGIILRFKSLEAAKRAESRIRYDPAAQTKRDLERWRRELNDRRRWS